jgi:hypothetical protein
VLLVNMTYLDSTTCPLGVKTKTPQDLSGEPPPFSATRESLGSPDRSPIARYTTPGSVSRSLYASDARLARPGCTVAAGCRAQLNLPGPDGRLQRLAQIGKPRRNHRRRRKMKGPACCRLPRCCFVCLLARSLTCPTGPAQSPAEAANDGAGCRTQPAPASPPGGIAHAGAGAGDSTDAAPLTTALPELSTQSGGVLNPPTIILPCRATATSANSRS